jgi:transposase
MKEPKCSSHQCQCPRCLQKQDHPDKDLHRQFNLLLSCLNEQQQRWVAAFLSRWIGFGGIRLVQVITGLSRLTIYRGLQELNDGLQDRPRDRICRLNRVRRPGGGRHLKLTGDQLKRLEQLLSEGATAHGWQNNLWTAKRVAQVIRKRLGVTVCIATVRRMLKEQIGWSLQKPAVQLRNRNDDEIARWRTEVFPGIVKKAWDGQSHLTFIDESGFMLSPTLRRTYAPRGHPPIIEVSDPHARISVIGAITLSPRHRHVRLTFQMLPDNANFHGESVAEFLRTLSYSVKGPNTIIWDSVRIHLAHLVQSYLVTRNDIVTETFPSNASDLNPVDSVWSYIKYSRLPNYTPFDLIQMRRRLTAELRRLQGQPDLLLSFISRAGLSETIQPL